MAAFIGLTSVYGSMIKPRRPIVRPTRQEDDAMAAKGKPAPPNTNRFVEDEDEEVVNDSLGTIHPADSTGTDEDKETGDAKKDNFPTRED
jgi:hypothetical protein